MVSIPLNELSDYVLLAVYVVLISTLIFLTQNPLALVAENTAYKTSSALSLISDEESVSANIAFNDKLVLNLDNQRTLQVLNKDKEVLETRQVLAEQSPQVRSISNENPSRIEVIVKNQKEDPN